MISVVKDPASVGKVLEGMRLAGAWKLERIL
jgi:hypothetical protein